MRSLPRPTSPEVPMLLTGGTGGLQHTLKYWWFSCVRAADRQLWAKLEGLGIQPEHFALRWLLVWGAREFALPDVLLLWDALMSNRARLTAAQQQPEADQSQSDDSRLEAEFLLDREVTRALQPACEGTEELIHPEQFRSVNFSAGRLDCNVRVQQSASGDDEDCSELGFLFDFFTAVLLAVRGRLLSMDFEQCIGFLQCLPRHIEELDMPQLLAETTRIRQRRAVARVVHACRSVLASAAPRKRSDSQAAKLAPLVNSLATTTTLASPEPQSPDPLIMVSKFFGQITGKLKFLQPGSAPTSPVSPLSPPPSATWDGAQAPAYLLLALARASAKGARQLHIYEVVDYSAATNTAAVRKMAECDAAAPSLVGIERQANRIDRTIVKVCLTPPEVAPMVSSVGKQAGELLAGPGSFSGSRSGGGSAAKLQHGRQGLPSLTIPKPAAGVRAASSSSTVVGDKEPFWWASMETEPRALGRTRIDFELCDFDSDDDE
ncbi:hypothetical protein EC988_003376 [Linderina pennispora]|nr:hypothetical protein EC988_003376 [Linderina pennispora]